MQRHILEASDYSIIGRFLLNLGDPMLDHEFILTPSYIVRVTVNPVSAKFHI
jgi:hypothetical protein